MLAKLLEPGHYAPQNSHRRPYFCGSVSLLESQEGRFIHVRAGHNFDLTNVWIFNGAVKLASDNSEVKKVVVDLGLTQRVFDSGKAMLLLLRNHLTPPLNQKVFVINAPQDVVQELSPYCLYHP